MGEFKSIFPVNCPDPVFPGMIKTNGNVIVPFPVVGTPELVVESKIPTTFPRETTADVWPLKISPSTKKIHELLPCSGV
jgi:hypothetical protein